MLLSQSSGKILEPTDGSEIRVTSKQKFVDKTIKTYGDILSGLQKNYVLFRQSLKIVNV